MKTGPFTFIASDGEEWKITGRSRSCGQNYVDVERVDGTKQSVRQTGIMRAAGHEIPEKADPLSDPTSGQGANSDAGLSHHPLAVAPEHVNVPVKVETPLFVEDAKFGGTIAEEHAQYGCLVCGDKTGACTPTTCARSEAQVSPGRFVLCTGWPERELVTSWNEWVDAQAAMWPIQEGYFFVDDATGLYLFPGWTAWATPAE